ncbi:MAG: pseudouridine-5'-phosphate glycosidase [Candidatus Cloacimonetes bacterium]|jgi:pseudouridylate synthase|nr:pseudouridine-5'-phosphate glycosidase [Candidatus Cloacimonadota bacterium]MBT6994817.1 pseudouridine-5'-phosphate glycosidase [Candidatus Cloacimonadota bacterium]MBT7470189.1 pseudouridine-5'-phosphate glycosidase [Candidatus Cloacimonadota bacterium]
MLQINKKVANAIQNNKPVIALESTIISHGMPYPQNIEVAKNLENIALENGVVPATICLMNGKIKVGLNSDELEILATAKNVKKISRRDIAKNLAKKEIGATTVAATMIVAKLAGINVFATGGVGGVHRFAEESFDISADLIEFSQTPIVVVSAGAKAILDLPKTLEFLETYGVPVYGFQTDKFPAFYSAKSNLNIERINSASEIANIFQINKKLGLKMSILVANPIPKQDEIPFDEMEVFILKATTEAKKNGIIGQAVTPFLLAKIVELTQGKSLKTNIKLVENNVKLACKIAKKL